MYKRVISVILAMVLAVMPASAALAEEILAESEIFAEGESFSDAENSVPEDVLTGDIVAENSESGSLVEDGLVGDIVEENVAESSEVADSLAGDAVTGGFTDGTIAGGDLTGDSVAGSIVDASVSGDDLILDIEEVVLENDLAIDDSVIVDQIVTEELSESGVAGDACAPLFRLYSARTAYVDSYGGQLDYDAAALYSALVNAYMTERGRSELKYTLSEPLTFSVPDGVIVQENGSNKMKWDSDNNAEYQDALSTLRYIVQASYDAMIYDYPEIFWMSAPVFSWSISFRGSAGSYTGMISEVTWKPIEKYEGASSQIAAFDTAVKSTYEQLNASLNGDVSTHNKVKVIHDYLCDNVVYAENALAHTAAGVFLQDDKRVVCEGYAKSFMILCRRFGIESVLIPGGAKTSSGVEGHMWNYVKMEDGKWYLVDATWDDQKTSISDTYFLAGNQSVGFRGTTLYEERESNRYSNFSGSGNTFLFSFPVLSECRYHTEHIWGELKTFAATCVSDAKENAVCTVAGCDAVSETVREGTALGHDFAQEYTVDRAETCEKAGQRSRHCSRCDAVTDEREISAPGHDWNVGRITTEATCTKTGIKTYTCSRCDDTKTETVNAFGHNWNAGKITKEATCTETGIKAYTCSRCGDTKTETVNALGHSWNIGEITVKPMCMEAGEKTYTCTRCGSTKTETVAELGHDFAQEFTVDQEATCDLTGSRSRHCSRCSAVTEPRAIPAHGHRYGEYTMVSGPTALAEGHEVHSCRICGDVQSRIIPRLRAKLSLNVTSLKLKVGQSTTDVKVSGLAKGDSVISWKSSKPKTVKVTKSGKITGKKAGAAVVTVTLASGRTAEIRVKVQKAAVRTTGISGLPKKIMMEKGQKIMLRPVIAPITSRQKVKYRSSNKKTATVNGRGIITAKKAGKAKITVRSGSKKATVTVIVSRG